MMSIDNDPHKRFKDIEVGLGTPSEFIKLGAKNNAEAQLLLL